MQIPAFLPMIYIVESVSSPEVYGLINIIPARPPEHNSLAPCANWMNVAHEVLDEALAGFTPQGLRPEYSYYTKPIKYKDTEIVQAFFGNWTFHWQMSWHGEEEYDQQERYGDQKKRIRRPG
jgi:hypothetical protein